MRGRASLEHRHDVIIFENLRFCLSTPIRYISVFKNLYPGKHLSGPVHTYPDIIENEGFFSRFQKSPRPHVAFPNRFCLSTTSDVIVFKNRLFPLPTRLQKIPGYKIYFLEPVFKKLQFRLPKTPFTCGRKPYPE